MRKTRIGALVASTALASATILGGAGAANASVEDVFGSLDFGGSIFPEEQAPAPSLDLNITDADHEGAEGTVAAQNVDEAIEGCYIGVSTADVVSDLEEAYYDETNEEVTGLGFADLLGYDPLDAPNEAGQNWAAVGVDIPEGEVANWVGTQRDDAPEPDDYQAGAWATCDVDGETVVAFDYEAADQGPLGSLDVFGSLGGMS